jgi:hypothetical protein
LSKKRIKRWPLIRSQGSEPDPHNPVKAHPILSAQAERMGDLVPMVLKNSRTIVELARGGMAPRG